MEYRIINRTAQRHTAGANYSFPGGVEIPCGEPGRVRETLVEDPSEELLEAMRNCELEVEEVTP